MSFEYYIGHLGITRLKEIGKILRIPGYYKYTEPDDLRNHIKEHLDENGSVNSEYLKRIRMNKQKFKEATSHIIAIVDRKLNRQKYLPIHYDNQITEKLQEIERCYEEDKNCIPDKNLLEALKKYAKQTNSENFKEIVQRVLESTKELNNFKLEREKELDKCKDDAVKALQDAQTLQKELEGKLVNLSSQLKVQESMRNEELSKLRLEHAKEKRNIEKAHLKDIEDIEEIVVKLTTKVDEASTLNTVITQLKAEKGELSDKSTRFQNELNELHLQMEKLKQDHQTKINEALDKVEKCNIEKERVSMELRNFRESSVKDINKLKEILRDSGEVNKRTLEKFQRAFKEKEELVVKLSQCQDKDLPKLSAKLEEVEKNLQEISEKLIKEKELNVLNAQKTATNLKYIESLLQESITLKTNFAKLQRENEKCIKSLNEGRKQYEEECTNKVNKLQDNFGLERKQYEDCTNKVNKLQEDFGSERKQYEEECTNKVNKLQEDFGSERKQYEEDCTNKVNKLQEDFIAYQSIVQENCNSSIKKLQEDFGSERKQYEENCNSSISSLTENLRSKELEIIKLKDDLKECQASRQRLDLELELLKNQLEQSKASESKLEEYKKTQEKLALCYDELNAERDENKKLKFEKDKADKKLRKKLTRDSERDEQLKRAEEQIKRFGGVIPAKKKG